jgi:hypothetical protein
MQVASVGLRELGNIAQGVEVFDVGYMSRLWSSPPPVTPTMDHIPGAAFGDLPVDFVGPEVSTSSRSARHAEPPHPTASNMIHASAGTGRLAHQAPLVGANKDTTFPTRDWIVAIRAAQEGALLMAQFDANTMAAKDRELAAAKGEAAAFKAEAAEERATRVLAEGRIAAAEARAVAAEAKAAAAKEARAAFCMGWDAMPEAAYMSDTYEF